MVLGICGPAGSGKNTVCKILAGNGFLIIDADAIGQQVLQLKQQEIVQAFGSAILTETNTIDRKKLGSIVFASDDQLKKLNAISHPSIVDEMRRLIHTHPDSKIALNAALLPWVKVPEVDVLIWVTAKFYIRLKRTLRRDRRGLFFTLKRMWAQRNLSPKLFFKRVDTYTVRNDGDLYDLERRVDKLLDLLSSKDKKAAQDGL